MRHVRYYPSSQQPKINLSNADKTCFEICLCCIDTERKVKTFTHVSKYNRHLKSHQNDPNRNERKYAYMLGTQEDLRKDSDMELDQRLALRNSNGSPKKHQTDAEDNQIVSCLKRVKTGVRIDTSVAGRAVQCQLALIRYLICADNEEQLVYTMTPQSPRHSPMT